MFESGSAFWIPKKAQNGLPWAPKATLVILLHVVWATECDKKGGMPVTELLNTFIDRAFNIFYKFGVKVKVWSKVTAHEMRGTNFWYSL